MRVGIYAQVAALRTFIDATAGTSNAPPDAAPDSYTVFEDILFTVDAATGVAANDTDPEDTSPPGGMAVEVTPPMDPFFVMDPDGSFRVCPA